jgi:hypothetical protein
LLAERVGLVDNVILAPLPAKSEMIGKMLIRSIENSNERL